jgi:hypothetical protein
MGILGRVKGSEARHESAPERLSESILQHDYEPQNARSERRHHFLGEDGKTELGDPCDKNARQAVVINRTLSAQIPI